MTRAERIRKLGNAVREYRGMFHPETKAWIHAPKLGRLAGVKLWIGRLGLDERHALEFIDNCRTWAELREWMAKLDPHWSDDPQSDTSSSCP